MAAPVDELDAHLEFSTFIGGKRDGTLREIAFDSAGNIVVAGHGAEFVADNFPIATIIGPAANQNVLVAKFTKAGKLVWMTIIGGSGLDRGYGVVLDKADNIYVAGRTSSSDFPTTPGAYDTTFNGGTPNPVVHGPSDAYVLKLSSDGKRLLYSTYLGGSKNDGARGGLAVDTQGFAYVVGATESADFLGDEQAKVNGFLGKHSDAFIVKVSQDGKGIVYCRFLGGTTNDGTDEGATEMAPGVQVDESGHAYVHAIVLSADALTTKGAFQREFGGGKSDSYIAKLSPDGKQLLYATYLGGSEEEYGEHRLALDPKGNVYVAGQTTSLDFPVKNAHQPTHGGTTDGFLAKLDSTGHLLFATYIGGSGVESAFGPAVDNAGNVFVAGPTESGDFQVTPKAYDLTLDGGQDAYVQIYSSEGQQRYSTLLGGSGKDTARYVATDRDGGVFVTGETTSMNFPTTPGVFQSSYSESSDGFLLKLKLERP